MDLKELIQNHIIPGGWHHDFLVENEQEPKLFFLYRPGHYDVLYKRDGNVDEPRPSQQSGQQ